MAPALPHLHRKAPALVNQRAKPNAAETQCAGGKRGLRAALVSRATAAEPRWEGVKGLVLPAGCSTG